MARCNVGEDEAETEIVFDSQGEEDDAWPESQSSEKGTDKDDLIGAQKARTSRVYGKQGKVHLTLCGLTTLDLLWRWIL